GPGPAIAGFRTKALRKASGSWTPAFAGEQVQARSNSALELAAHPDARLVVDPHHVGAERGAVDHHGLAVSRAKRKLAVVGLHPQAAVGEADHPVAEAVLAGRGHGPLERGHLVLRRLAVVAAAEDRQARQSEAEQPAPAFADLGAIDDDQLAPFRRLLERCGGRVEAAQPLGVPGNRTASDERLEQLGPRLILLSLRRGIAALRVSGGYEAEHDGGEQERLA